jgi:hypothetical protein
MTPQSHHFALCYNRAMRAFLGLLGLGPRHSGVELNGEELRVRMGWGFAARILRQSISQAQPLTRRRDIWYALGIHTLLGGRWIVNGSLTGVVTLAIEPPVRARAFGLPIRLRWLAMSLQDPEEFLTVLGGSQV